MMLSGRIKDADSGEGIPYALVLIKGTKKSVTANDRGYFEIKSVSPETTLVIFQFGYETKEIVTTANNLNEIKLRSKLIALKEVNVTVNKIDTFQVKNNTIFLAFEFYDNFIVALVNKGNQYNVIQLINEKGVIVKEKKAPAGVDKMYTDCIGNIQLLSKENCYQFFYDYDNIVVMDKFPITDFYSKIQPCQCRFGNYFYFKEVYHKRLKNRYFLVSENNKNDRKIIKEVENKWALDMFDHDYDINYFLAKRKTGAGYATSVDELLLHIDELRENVELKSDYAFKLIPVQSELVKRDSFLLLIDYTNKFIEKYNFLGKLIKRDSLLIANSFFTTVTDIDTHKLYFLSENKGTAALKEYSEGIFSKELTIEKFRFINNIKCRNGYLYFISKDPLNSESVYKIYKYSLF